MLLFQGPPGTGKTRTILNLLSVVMHSANKGALELQKGAAGSGGRGGAADDGAASRLADEDKARLWVKQAPWVAGKPDLR